VPIMSITAEPAQAIAQRPEAGGGARMSPFRITKAPIP
jgi:hypothetical protein